MGQISNSFVDTFGNPDASRRQQCFLVCLLYTAIFILLCADAAQNRSAHQIKAVGKNGKETKGDRNEKELEKEAINMEYKGRMGVRKGDSYPCEKIKGENTRISREGVFSRPEHPLDRYLLEVERSGYITYMMIYLELTLIFILMVAFPKWFWILCDCALYSQGEITVQSDSPKLFFPVFRYGGITDFLIAMHGQIFVIVFLCEIFCQKKLKRVACRECV